MAKQAVYDYSTTASSNSDFDGTDSSGATGKVKDGDNYARSIASHIKGFANDLGGINTVAGTGDAITITLSAAPSALVDGMRLTFNASAANTTNVTLNVTPAGGAAFGSKKVLKWAAGVETALSANDIPAANALIELVYDTARDTAAGAWMLLGTSPVVAATTSASGIAKLQYLAPFNLDIEPTVGASALTISLKGLDGNDPSATNPVVVPFRNVTPGTGAISQLTVTAATSLVISSGSTLGAPTGSVPFKVWIVAFNDAGTFRLGAILCTTLASGILTQYPLSDYGIASSTAEGGAGAADSAQTFYTGTAVTSKAYTVLAALSFETGLATAGTWASAPTRTQIFDGSVPLPGRSFLLGRTQSSAVFTDTTHIPYDDTIPQITEGTEIVTKAVTPGSAANLLKIRTELCFSPTNGDSVTTAIFQDATANAIAANGNTNQTGFPGMTDVEHYMIAGQTTSTTFRVRIGANSQTTTVNGSGGARRLGGVGASYLAVEEIVA